MENTSAILLRKIKLTETSLIITWFSAACGKIKTVAKGARSPASKFSGRLDLFFDCDIQFSRSRRSELHILREVVLKSAHEGLRADYERLALAAYFVELIELVTEPEHPALEIYELLQRAFRYLNERPPTKKILLHFESELVRFLGIENREVSAAIAIGRVYQRLPPSRSALLKWLGSTESGRPA